MQSVLFSYEGLEVTLFTHDAPDHLFNVLSRQKTFYELDLLKKAARVYTRGSWIIDVGANIGNHSIFFAKVLLAPVLAFEPFPKNREILVRNIQVNGCHDLVRVEASALGEANGRAAVKSYSADNFGTVRIEADPAGDLPIATLDSFVTADMSLSIIKIDVEGSELAVLKGAANTLRFRKPHLFIEASAKAELDEIKAFLRDFGYEVRGRYCATPTYLFSAIPCDRTLDGPWKQFVLLVNTAWKWAAPGRLLKFSSALFF